MTTLSPARHTLPVSGYSWLSDLLLFLTACPTVCKWAASSKFPEHWGAAA